MITVTCRRCIADNELELESVLDAGDPPGCATCGKPIVRGDRLPGSISAANYILPRDVQAMRALRRVPGLVRIVQLYAKVMTDDDLLLDQYAESIHVTAEQLPQIYQLYVEAGGRLGFGGDSLPPLFVEPDRAPNARTAGVERPFVAVSRGLLEILTPDEVLAVLGHELGHVQAGHFTYTTAMLRFKDLVGVVANLTPVRVDDLVFKLIGDPAVLAWIRTAERTADQAGMLAARRPRDMVTAMMKIAGAPPASMGSVDYRSFIRQTELFEEIVSRSLRRRLLMAKDILRRTHPFPATRVGEMVRLLDSPEWFDILERVLDANPGRWERSCSHCGGMVAEWDVICRHCAWTVDSSEEGSDSEPPPDAASWKEAVGERAGRVRAWRPRGRGASEADGRDTGDETAGPELP